MTIKSDPVIIVRVDGSQTSEDALRWAAGQAQLTGGELHAVITWQTPSSYGYYDILTEPALVERQAPVAIAMTHSGLARNHRPLSRFAVWRVWARTCVDYLAVTTRWREGCGHKPSVHQPDTVVIPCLFGYK